MGMLKHIWVKLVKTYLKELDDKIYHDRRAGFNIELENNIYTVIKEGDEVIVV